MNVALYPKESLESHIHWFLAGVAEAGDQGEATAGAGGAVAEEVAGAGGGSGAGGESGRVYLRGGDAGFDEGVAVGGPQVEEPAVRAQRPGWRPGG